MPKFHHQIKIALGLTNQNGPISIENDERLGRKKKRPIAEDGGFVAWREKVTRKRGNTRDVWKQGRTRLCGEGVVRAWCGEGVVW